MRYASKRFEGATLLNTGSIPQTRNFFSRTHHTAFATRSVCHTQAQSACFSVLNPLEVTLRFSLFNARTQIFIWVERHGFIARYFYLCRKNMIRFFPGEEWREIGLKRHLKSRYAISNFGRLMSFKSNLEKGRLLKGCLAEGYPVFKYRVWLRDKRDKLLHQSRYLHQLVAEYFLPKPKSEQKFIIHIDYDKSNNRCSNLKWVSKGELVRHHERNPNVILGKAKNKNRKPYAGKKLTETRVKYLKRRIFDPNRKTRLKMIAKQFGISEMQLYRIKKGENWGHVSLEG